MNRHLRLLPVLFLGCATTHADINVDGWARLQQGCATFTKVRFGVEFVWPGPDRNREQVLVHMASSGAIGADRGSSRWAWSAQAGVTEDSRAPAGPTLRHSPSSPVAATVGALYTACRAGLSGWTFDELTAETPLPESLDAYAGSGIGEIGAGCGEVIPPDNLLGENRVFLCFGDTTLAPEVIGIARPGQRWPYYAMIVGFDWNSAFPDPALSPAAPPLSIRPPRPLEWIGSDTSFDLLRTRPLVVTPLPGDATPVPDSEPPPDPPKCYSEAVELIPCP